MRSLWHQALTVVSRTLATVEVRAGQAMVEYALIISLVVLVILVTLIVLGNTVKNTYCNIESAVVGA
jgi:Flp pilus assembly pilin Flp